MPFTLHTIVCSTRPGRVGLAVAQWFHEIARRHGGFDARLVDKVQFYLAPVFTGGPVPAVPSPVPAWLRLTAKPLSDAAQVRLVLASVQEEGLTSSEKAATQSATAARTIRIY